MNKISIENISFSYNDKKIFEDFSVQFPMGETSILMSPSGRGKTTLLYIMAGLLKVDSGSISIPADSSFSIVFQDLRLVESISVYKNIKMVNSALSKNDIEEALNYLHLSGLGSKTVKNLSGGQKQRVAIARALLANFDILLLDEPFTGLDDAAKNSVIEYIKSRTANKTVLLITHDENEASLMSGTLFNI